VIWFDWLRIHPQIFTLIVIGSAVFLLVMILFAPYIAALIPEDYFSDPEHRTLPRKNPIYLLFRRIMKNLLGLILLVLGIIMLVTPGQGLLTIFVALIALDYPGKYQLERWLFSKQSIRRGLNWLRDKANAPPLQYED
jgi:hypothetical protein